MERKDIQLIIDKHSLYTSMLTELLKSLLTSSEIKYHIIESRTKSIDSLEEKVQRKEITDIRKEITDVSGLRIILYYQDDVDKVIKMIENNFIIDKLNSINKADLYNSNEFGYLSIHKIVSLNSKRNKLPEWESFSSLKAEIQVRTVLQHSWASISHELTYKKNYDIPKVLQRKLFRLAGLFELADEEFLAIRDEHNNLELSIKKISQSNKINTENINLLTLKFSFKKEKSIYSSIEKIAIDSGFLSKKYTVKDDNYLSQFILVADIVGLKQINEINELFTANIEKFKVYFKDLKSASNTKWYGGVGFFNLLALLFFLNNEELELFNSKINWSNEIFDRVVKAINKNR